jgi:hypothetical protein
MSTFWLKSPGLVKNQYAASARILYIEPMLKTIAKVRTMANGG